ncbi:MAG: hypothetical protein OQK82_05420 [Candidatus Pacearchaeota archaeon]|nr:hypothetical protein [Candidatus Pacearchaeota archaeon]
MILDRFGNKISSEPDTNSRRGMNTDVFCLPAGASAPKTEYAKLMKILESGEVRQKLANSDKMPERKGMYNIYLDVHCGIRTNDKKQAEKLLEKHQNAFSDLAEKRANDENITETKKAYCKAV